MKALLVLELERGRETVLELVGGWVGVGRLWDRKEQFDKQIVRKPPLGLDGDCEISRSSAQAAPWTQG